MKNVYVIPGFLNSTLGILATGQVLWWDPSYATVLGLGAMRLAADGTSPQPPDGKQIGVDTVPMNPWGLILSSLRSQLDRDVWRIVVGPYDWRLDLNAAAQSLATSITTNSTVDQPATIVGHSAGGLVAVLAWSKLVATGNENKVRRIITIGTPFQGSYGSIQWMTGENPAMVQLLAVPIALQWSPASTLTLWSLDYLTNLALTWPAFYQLFPALGGSEAARDPNRTLLYDASNYRPAARPSAAWLDYARNTWQPQIAGPTTFPPAWVATYCAGTGLETPYKLKDRGNPLNLVRLGYDNEGDGIVTVESATRRPGKLVTVTGEHSSLPLGMSYSGQLARLITDSRGPPDPPPPDLVVKPPIAENMTSPPQADYVSGQNCLARGCIVANDEILSNFIIGR